MNDQFYRAIGSVFYLEDRVRGRSKIGRTLIRFEGGEKYPLSSAIDKRIIMLRLGVAGDCKTIERNVFGSISRAVWATQSRSRLVLSAH